MKHLFSKILVIAAIIIPSVLLSACSEKKEVIHVSSKSNVWLGVKVKDIPERRLKNLKLDFGLEVIKVFKDSPAEEAGLKVEDILLELNGKPLENVNRLRDIIGDMEIDDKIKINYLRNGEELEAEATLSKKNKRILVLDGKHKDRKYFVADEKRAWLGVLTSGLTDQLREYFNVPEYLGVLIKEVQEDSPAEKHGLRAGDVIIQVGRKEIEDSHDLSRAIDRYEPGEEVDVKIIRDKKEKSLKITLGEGKARFPRHLSFHPYEFDVYVPDMEIDIPEMHIEIPELDAEELEELHEKMREELEIHSDELNEELKELEEELEELKEIKIHTRHRRSAVI
jgi:membrane-associated protease RseP (regulator of RpoE activity)